MNELFPIIRRKRRPLVVEESVPDGPPKPPVVVGNAEPVKVTAQDEDGGLKVEDGAAQQHRPTDSENPHDASTSTQGESR